MFRIIAKEEIEAKGESLRFECRQQCVWIISAMDLKQSVFAVRVRQQTLLSAAEAAVLKMFSGTVVCRFIISRPDYATDDVRMIYFV